MWFDAYLKTYYSMSVYICKLCISMPYKNILILAYITH